MTLVGQPPGSRIEKDPTPRKACIRVRLPCITVAPASADGLLKGVAAAEAPPAVWGMYSDVKKKPLWQAKEAEARESFRMASEVFGENSIGDMGWRIGEMLVLEEEAGERCPLSKLYERLTGEQHCSAMLTQDNGFYVKMQRELRNDPGNTHVADPTARQSRHPPVRVGCTANTDDANDKRALYLKTLDCIREAYRAGFDMLYGDEALKRYIAEGCLRLLNALLRCKVYGRREDRQDLQAVAAAVGGLHGLEYHEDSAGRVDQTTTAGDISVGDATDIQLENVSVALLSLHDHSIIGFLSTLGVYDHKRVPAAAKVYVELLRKETVSEEGGGEATDRKESDRTDASRIDLLGQRSASDLGTSGSSRGPSAAELVSHEGQSGYQPMRQLGVHRSLAPGSENSNAHTPWPESSTYVRVSYGSSGQPLAVLRLPFCAQHCEAGCSSEVTACPLAVWLHHTYAALDR
ncbi:histidine acid phosphatase superfamily protein [Cystoisospora suis]|uniref:Histidine acid phosphatase superfamily protein n=1 Tax=Cystoisospora suis TaxID=483139 RepID=A0A2C6J533_9APIC|nr:histidine acid phosphatase superfamily protein [Cystoisospora suis]